MQRHHLFGGLIVVAAMLLAGAMNRAGAQQFPLPADMSDPRIVVLLPGGVTIEEDLRDSARQGWDIIERKVEESLEKEGSLIFNLQRYPALANVADPDLTAETWKSIYRQKRFENIISLMVHQGVGIKLSELLPESKVHIRPDSSVAEKEYLAGIARKYGVTYVIGFPRVHFFTRNSRICSDIGVQVYDSLSGSMLVDTGIVQENPPGCCIGTVDQTAIFSNLRLALPSLVETTLLPILRTVPKIQILPSLREAKRKELLRRYHGSSCSPRFSALLMKEPTLPPISELCSCILNGDSSQIVAFYLDTVPSPRSEEIEKKSSDGVKNGSDAKSYDANFSVVLAIGALVDTTWYFESVLFSHINAESPEDGRRKFFTELEGFNFFHTYSLEPDPAFWESGFFRKVTDIRDDPAFRAGDELWESLLRENEGYVGMYEFVADKLREERRRNEK